MRPFPAEAKPKKDDCATRFLFGFLFQTESRSSEAAAQSDGRANKTDGGKIIGRRFGEAGQKMESKLWHTDKQADDGQIKAGDVLQLERRRTTRRQEGAWPGWQSCESGSL